jgi:hypothetical protein
LSAPPDRRMIDPRRIDEYLTDMRRGLARTG